MPTKQREMHRRYLADGQEYEAQAREARTEAERIRLRAKAAWAFRLADERIERLRAAKERYRSRKRGAA
jgi:hypothetical protein